MAARSDAATDRVTLSSAPSMATITIGGWAKIEAASASSFNPIARFHVNSGDATSWVLGFKGTNGRTPSVYSPGNTTGISAAEQSLSTYVYVAATLSGTAAQLLYGNTPGSLTKVTGTVAASGTPDRITLFGRSAADGSEWLNGTLAYMRIWTAVLSDSEIAAESQSSTPVRTSGLWASWPFAAAALTDGSGNSRNLTAGSTALASATDPVFGITGTGALTAPPAVASGAATATVAGSGALTAPPAVAAGAGAAVVTGAGSPTAPKATLAGAGAVTVAGSGAAAAPPGSSVGAGVVIVAGFGALSTPQAVAAGSGAAVVASVGVLTAPTVSASGAGGAVVTASGACTAPPAVVAGTGGAAAAGGSGALVAPAAAVAGTGQAIITGAGACVAPSAIVAGVDRVPVQARTPVLTIMRNPAVLAIRASGGSLQPRASRTTVTVEGAA